MGWVGWVGLVLGGSRVFCWSRLGGSRGCAWGGSLGVSRVRRGGSLMFCGSRLGGSRGCAWGGSLGVSRVGRPCVGWVARLRSGLVDWGESGGSVLCWVGRACWVALGWVARLRLGWVARGESGGSVLRWVGRTIAHGVGRLGRVGWVGLVLGGSRVFCGSRLGGSRGCAWGGSLGVSRVGRPCAGRIAHVL